MKERGASKTAKRNYSPEEIVRYLRDVEILQGKGKSTSEACRELSINVAAYYRWRKQYGTMQVNEAKRLKELEKENTRLKKSLAEVILDNQVLKDINLGNY